VIFADARRRPADDGRNDASRRSSDVDARDARDGGVRADAMRRSVRDARAPHDARDDDADEGR